MRQPGGNKALLAFGAQLLSAPTFAEGFGKGAMAYQDTLDREEDRIKPKTQFLSDGAYKATIDPVTGQVKMERTPLADYAEGLQEKKLLNAMTIAGIRDDGQTRRNLDMLTHKDRWEAQDSDDARYGIDKRSATDLEVAQIGAASRLEAARLNGPGGKPPPAAIQKQVSDYTDVRNGLANTAESIAPVIQALESGKLPLGILSNNYHKFALATGIGGNEQTVLYSQYKTALEGMRNALLLANKGVQTDGDADRAMAEIDVGGGDLASTLNNFRIVQRSIQRRQAQAQGRIDDLSGQYGADVSHSSPRPQARVASGRTKAGITWEVVR